MNRILVPLTLVLLAMSIGGCRELINPKGGYVIVPDKDSPVSIRTRDLEGAGYINMLNQSKQWVLMHFSPGGAFSFNEPLPDEAWHCKPRHGCVAALRVGDDKGFFATSKEGRIYVCTEDYRQQGGRARCGSRTMELGNLPPWDPTKPLTATLEWKTHAAHPKRSEVVPGHTHVREWQGDGAQRLFSGFHEWENTNDPWHPPKATDVSGSWQEHPWYRGFFGNTPLDDTEFVSGDMYSVDIGASRIFVPWSGEHYIPGGAYQEELKGVLDDMGLGEIMIERSMQDPFTRNEYTENVKLYFDAMTNIWTRTDVSPEFHFRVNDAGDRQVCLVSYVTANNRLSGKPDSWFRFDQGFLSFFAQWFGIGDCRTHPARVQFCGTLDYEDGAPQYTIDPDSVGARIEPYSLFKPLCRKKFAAPFESGIPAALAEPAQQDITNGLSELFGLFNAITGGATIRRIEPTPTGLYLITAETFLDPQYGIGDSTPELEKTAPGRTQPNVVLPSVPATGITRPVP